MRVGNKPVDILNRITCQCAKLPESVGTADRKRGVLCREREIKGLLISRNRRAYLLHTQVNEAKSCI